MVIEILSEENMRDFGARIGALLRGGEAIELVGDVGAGKTTLTKGIATGLGVDEDVQSPSFTISRVYETARGLTLVHYDFYRLTDAGIMGNELEETVHDDTAVTIVEWADIVTGVLPDDRLVIGFSSPSETMRRLEINGTGPKSQSLVEKLQ